MMFQTNWIILAGFCLSGGSDKGFCTDIKNSISVPPNFDNDNVTIEVDGRVIKEKKIAIEVSEDMSFGIVSKIPSELAFKNTNHCNAEILELSKILIKNNVGECISIESILSLASKAKLNG